MYNIIENPVKVLKPAILPDDIGLLLVILTIEIIALLAGLVTAFVCGVVGSPALLIISFSLVAMFLFPGLSVIFHFIYHFLSRFEIYDDKISFTSHTPNKYIDVGRHQQMSYKDIVYVYYFETEIDFLAKYIDYIHSLDLPIDYASFLKEQKYTGFGVSFKDFLNEYYPDGTIDEDICKVLLRTRLKIETYFSMDERYRPIGTARANTYLVLANRDGNQKAYLYNFYDLSGSDSRHLMKILKQKSPNIEFLMMDPNKTKRIIDSL